MSEWLPEPSGEGEIDLELSEPDADEIEVELPETDASEVSGEREFELGDIEIDVDEASIDVDEVDPAAQTEHSQRPVAPAARPGAVAAAPAAPRPAAAPGASASASASQQIGEDLEEADFYYQQGLHGEAEAIYQRVVAQAPNHPLALVRLGEIAAARGADPGATGGGFAAGSVEADEPEAASDPSIGSDLADWNEASDGAAAAPVASDLGSGSDLEIEIEDEPEAESEAAEPESVAAAAADASTEDEVEPVVASAKPQPIAASAKPQPIAASPKPQPMAKAPAPVVEVSEPEEALDPDADTASDLGASAPTAPLPGGDDANFDLAAELSEVFGEDRDGASGSGASGSDDGFAAVFGEFKKGVSRMLSEGDHEAHYDLGIAYREMGLLGDAISEFRAAMGNDARRIDCLHMMGLCTLEQGSAAAAVQHFEEALAAKNATPEQQLAVRFELGRAFQALGDRVRARSAFEAVAAIDPTFCDVEERLETVDDESKPEAPAAAAGAGFESFDDLMSEDAEAGAAAASAQENFDDVIAEANDEDAEPERARCAARRRARGARAGAAPRRQDPPRTGREAGAQEEDFFRLRSRRGASPTLRARRGSVPQ